MARAQDVKVDVAPHPAKKDDYYKEKEDDYKEKPDHQDVNVNVAVPPLPEKKDDFKEKPDHQDVSVNAAVPPFPSKDHLKKEKEELLAPAPGAKPGVDVSVTSAGRRLQTFNSEGQQQITSLVL